jgi:hypothetical protein
MYQGVKFLIGVTYWSVLNIAKKKFTVVYISKKISKSEEVLTKKVKLSELCCHCFNPCPPSSLVSPQQLKYCTGSDGEGMAGGLLAPRIVFTIANVVFLGVFLPPSCHMLRAT